MKKNARTKTVYDTPSGMKKYLAPTNSIETERLLLIPLSHKQLLSYVKPGHLLEKELGLFTGQRTISPELQEAIQEAILPAMATNSEDSLFYTLWTIIHKDQKIMVGDCCFKGIPDEKGEIEIGYGTYPGFQGKGYMSEAVKAFCQWAFSHPHVKAIIAETAKENLASQKILLKNSFILYQEQEEMFWWRIDKSPL